MQLVGPQGRELKVKDPEKYHFRPRELLSKLVQIYVNMRTEEDFSNAVQHDSRSFKPQLLKRAASLAGSGAFHDFVDQMVRQVQLSGPRADAEEPEVPEEFLDGLMFTVMEDPVLLPSSRMVLDRSTITAHLLNNPIDPFNRSPLQIQDLIPGSFVINFIRCRAKVQDPGVEVQEVVTQ